MESIIEWKGVYSKKSQKSLMDLKLNRNKVVEKKITYSLIMVNSFFFTQIYFVSRPDFWVFYAKKRKIQ